ncbi:MAG TPA: lactonase family protein [Streptosporangiaceae bacterium]|jgi:6-phosphogluconolactonase
MFDVLAGSYGPADVAGVRRFRFDPERRTFTAAAERGGVPFPAYLARAAATGWYYAISETTAQPQAGPGTSAAQTGQPGTVWALGPDPVSPQRWPAGHLATGAELPTHLAVHPSGRWLAVANYGCHPSPGSVSIVRVHPDGSLAELTSQHRHDGHGPVATRQDIAHVHSTMFDVTGDRLIAADLGSDALVLYAFDPANGRLRALSTTRTPPGWGPRYMLGGPTAATLLVVGELATEIGVFVLDGDALELIQRTSTLSQPRDGVLAADIHASPDGRRVYVSNRGAVNTIATFDTTRYDRPELIGEAPSGGNWPRHFAVTPDGRFLVVANEHSGRLTALAIEASGLVAAPVAAAEAPNVSYVETSYA